MKAKLVSENINFERGQDPKETMKIGLEARTLEVTEITAKSYFAYSQEEILKILNHLVNSRNPGMDMNRKEQLPDSEVLFLYYIVDEWEEDYSMKELKSPNNDFLRIRYKGEYYIIQKYS